MLTFMAVSAVAFLVLGLPFVVLILASLILALLIFLPELDMMMLMQQFLTGFTPATFAAVPMFILAAAIIMEGQSANRLVNFVRAFLGHIPGGLPIVTSASCTLFGSVSGSTQATVAAIGGPMRPMLLKAGYPDSFTMGLIINSSDIAILIPPSIAAIIYGVITKTSIGQLFLAGIGPGVLVFVLFSIYCFFYSKIRKIGLLPKASWAERRDAIKKGVLLLGFPLIIMGGIYTGTFTPTEAAAVSVVYALVLEGLVYRSLSFANVPRFLLSTSVITAVVYVLVGAGNAIAKMLVWIQVPQDVMPFLFGGDPSSLKLIIMINIAYFIAGMFTSPTVAMYILTPFYMAPAAQAGINPIFLGTLVILQAGIASATPPFGCDIFTAMMLFRRPYLEVIRHTPPFIAILLLVLVLIITFPDIALFIPRHAFGS